MPTAGVGSILSQACVCFCPGFTDIRVCRLDSTGLAAVGWSNAKFTEAHLWFRQTLRFKLTLVLPVLAHFLRGVFSTQHGFSFAQKDTMLISALYPLMLMLIWTTAYCSVVLKWADLILVPPLVFVSYTICAHLGQVHPVEGLLRCAATSGPLPKRQPVS